MSLIRQPRLFAAAAVAIGLLGVASAAQAHTDVQLSIGIPGVVAAPMYAPYPRYAQPAPVYVQPQPVYVQPRPVYVQPRPVYVQPDPVYVRTAPVWTFSHWPIQDSRREQWREHERHERHERYERQERDHDWDRGGRR